VDSRVRGALFSAINLRLSALSPRSGDAASLIAEELIAEAALMTES
jgi:hypothetical protein